MSNSELAAEYFKIQNEIADLNQLKNKLKERQNEIVEQLSQANNFIEGTICSDNIFDYKLTMMKKLTYIKEMKKQIYTDTFQLVRKFKKEK